VALQLVHEAALCVNGVRQQRTLSQKGFELLHGLPFVVSDMAVHQLLGAHTVAEAQQLQITLGLLRRASGHFCGHLLAIDPHRVRSYSKRQMRRHRKDNEAKPTKVAQTFFVLDADTHQPVCFTTGSASRTVAQATPELLDLAHCILKPDCHGPLVPRFRNNVMVFGPVLLPQWEALRWSLRSLSPKDVSHAWSPTELPP